MTGSLPAQPARSRYSMHIPEPVHILAILPLPIGTEDFEGSGCLLHLVYFESCAASGGLPQSVGVSAGFDQKAGEERAL